MEMQSDEAKQAMSGKPLNILISYRQTGGDRTDCRQGICLKSGEKETKLKK